MVFALRLQKGYVCCHNDLAESNSSKSSHDRATVSTLLSSLKECSRSKDLKKGKALHSQAVISGLQTNLFVGNSFINMFIKCGCLHDAQNVFDYMSKRDVVSWTTLIMGYVGNGKSEKALELFQMFESSGGDRLVDARVYVAVLSACSKLAAKQMEGESRKKLLERGRSIHFQAVTKRCCDIFVQTTLIDMYAHCGSMKDAREVFDSMVHRNVISWNALLQGYVENGESELALDLFEGMQRARRGCAPNGRTYIAAVSACASLAARDERKPSRWLEKGTELHARADSSQCCTPFVESSLVDMYARCGSMLHARRVFDAMKRPGIVAWNVLLQGYVDNNQSEVALELFHSMEQKYTPDARTYVSALSACTSLASREDAHRWLEKGRVIHSRAAETGSCTIFVECTALDMYSKFGRMELAQTVFDNMKNRNVVAWTALIMGYAENGENKLALELVSAMEASGVVKNSRTYVAALMAAGNLMALETGISLHAELRSLDLEKDIMVANCLVDFYGKCGCMDVAEQVFGAVSRKTVVSWNSLMCGYSSQGDTGRVLELFERMREQGVSPNDVTFVCVLTACSHAGLKEKGEELFNTMSSVYGVSPNVKHYVCMVDLFGRANSLDEAVRVVKNMPMEPGFVTWTAVLDACRKWNNVEIGRVAYDALLKLDRSQASTYVLMASIYKNLGMEDGWSEVVAALNLSQASSTSWWMESKGEVYVFNNAGIT